MSNLRVKLQILMISALSLQINTGNTVKKRRDFKQDRASDREIEIGFYFDVRFSYIQFHSSLCLMQALIRLDSRYNKQWVHVQF